MNRKLKNLRDKLWDNNFGVLPLEGTINTPYSEALQTGNFIIYYSNKYYYVSHALVKLVKNNTNEKFLLTFSRADSIIDFLNNNEVLW